MASQSPTVKQVPGCGFREQGGYSVGLRRGVGLIRQGDVMLIPLTRAPDEEGRQQVARRGGRLVLLEGEATGHAHAIADERAELVTVGEARELFLLVHGVAPVELLHEEHSTLLVPPGSYGVRRQREWSEDDDWAWVRD